MLPSPYLAAVLCVSLRVAVVVHRPRADRRLVRVSRVSVPLRKELLCHKWQHAHTNLHPLTRTFSRSRWKATKIKELQVGYMRLPVAQSGDWAASAGSIR